MTITFFKWTIFSKKDKDRLSNDEYKMLLYHEEHHRLNWWKKPTYKEELEAELYAMNKMMSEGLSLDQVISISVDYRMLNKFNVRLKDIKKLIDEEKNT